MWIFLVSSSITRFHCAIDKTRLMSLIIHGSSPVCLSLVQLFDRTSKLFFKHLKSTWTLSDLTEKLRQLDSQPRWDPHVHHQITSHLQPPHLSFIINFPSDTMHAASRPVPP